MRSPETHQRREPILFPRYEGRADPRLQRAVAAEDRRSLGDVLAVVEGLRAGKRLCLRARVDSELELGAP